MLGALRSILIIEAGEVLRYILSQNLTTSRIPLSHEYTVHGPQRYLGHTSATNIAPALQNQSDCNTKLT